MWTLVRNAALLSVLLLPNVASATERTITLTVDNMTCATCPPIVHKSLARVPGVKRVAVSAESNTATVVFNDAMATVAALVEATTRAGFPSRVLQ